MNNYYDYGSSYGGPKAPDEESASARGSDLGHAAIHRGYDIREFEVNRVLTKSEQKRTARKDQIATDSVFKHFAKGSMYYVVLLVGLAAAVLLVTGAFENTLFVVVPCLFAWIVSRLSTLQHRQERRG